MSAHAPSLQHVKLAISRQEESNSSFNISMPSTRFKHLELKVTMSYNDDDISLTDKDQEINAKVTTMKKKNSGLHAPDVIQYYYCKVPYDDDNDSITSQLHEFALIHDCTDTCQHNDDKDTFVCSCPRSATFCIECSSLISLELEIDGYDRSVLHPTPSY